MSNRRHLIYIESLSKYAFRVLRGLTSAQKEKFTPAEIKATGGEAVTWTTVNKEPMEHLLLLLTKAGKQWDLRIYDEEEDADMAEISAINQFHYPEKRLDLIDTMAKKELYYLSSSDVMLSASMCAQNSHTKVYDLSNTMRAAVKVTRGIARVKVPFHDQVKEAHETVDKLNRLLLNQLNSFDWAKSALGVTANEIRILCVLFAKKDGAMTMQDIAKGTVIEGKQVYLKKFIDKLLKSGLILSDQKHGIKTQGRKGVLPVYYLISSKGLGVIREYHNYVHKLTFGA